MVTGVGSSPPRYVPSFLSRIGFSISTARRFSSNVANSRSAFPLLVDFHRMLLTHALALSANQSICKKKSLRGCALGENSIHDIDFRPTKPPGTLHTSILYQYTNTILQRRAATRPASETFHTSSTDRSDPNISLSANIKDLYTRRTARRFCLFLSSGEANLTSNMIRGSNDYQYTHSICSFELT